MPSALDLTEVFASMRAIRCETCSSVSPRCRELCGPPRRTAARSGQRQCGEAPAGVLWGNMAPAVSGRDAGLNTRYVPLYAKFPAMMRRFSGSSTPVAPIASVLASAATPAAGDSSYPNVPAVAGASTVGDMGINAYESARYGSSARRVGLALIASLVLLVATGCGATSTTNVAPDLDCGLALRRPHLWPWTGFGAELLSDWASSRTRRAPGVLGLAARAKAATAERIMIDQRTDVPIHLVFDDRRTRIPRRRLRTGARRRYVPCRSQG